MKRPAAWSSTLPVGGRTSAPPPIRCAKIVSILAASGVPPQSIVVRTYSDRGAHLATIRISYPKIIAQAGPCGLWPEDIGPSFNRDYIENQPYWNLGCATQRNLAAMVDNPSDLVQPRGETPAYTARRTTVARKISRGPANRRRIRTTDPPRSATSANDACTRQ